MKLPTFSLPVLTASQTRAMFPLSLLLRSKGCAGIHCLLALNFGKSLGMTGRERGVGLAILVRQIWKRSWCWGRSPK